MDDCTRVSLVRKQVELTSQGRSELDQLGPPPSLPDIDAQCGQKPDPCNADDPNDPSYDDCRNYLSCVDAQCSDFNTKYNNWESGFNSATLPSKKYIDYKLAAQGQLRAIVNTQMTVPPAGSQVNALPHRHLSYMNPPFVQPNANLKFKGYITTGDPCGGGSGFTD